MKQYNVQTGRLGEKLAREELEKKGYQIIQTNFRQRFGEIDLIALYNQQLIFIEVKAKIGDDFGAPEEMINPHKLAQIEKTAYFFLQTHPDLAQKYPRWQIEAVCLVLNRDLSLKRLNHYQNLNQ